jgi:hypothetical protein
VYCQRGAGTVQHSLCRTGFNASSRRHLKRPHHEIFWTLFDSDVKILAKMRDATSLCNLYPYIACSTGQKRGLKIL